MTPPDLAEPSICLRCGNGVPDEWLRDRFPQPRSDQAIGVAFCMVCHGMVRVRAATPAESKAMRGER